MSVFSIVTFVTKIQATRGTNQNTDVFAWKTSYIGMCRSGHSGNQSEYKHFHVRMEKELYRYVPRDSVWCLVYPILK